MLYNLRVLQLHTQADLRAELRRIGAESSLLRDLVDKGTFRIVKLERVPSRLARFLYQELVLEGGEVVLPARLDERATPETEMLLLGTRYQLRHLVIRIRTQSDDELECALVQADGDSEGKVTSELFREINEQPAALARFLDAESANVERIAAAINRAGVKYVTIAARGTSDNAATYAKYVFASFNRLPVALATPSLYTVYHTPPRLTDSLVIGISQSGESPDIVAVVEEARRQGVPTLAITNFADSPLARTADHVILQHAGEEKTIAATKTYTTQLLALALLSTALANDRNRRKELDAVPNAVAQTLSLNDAVEQAAARWRDAAMCLVIGRGYNYATAFEIALKLKEVAYVTAEPFSSADFLHGPIALVQDGFPVIVIAPRGRVCDDLVAVARQLKEKGADLIAISDAPDALALGTPLALPASLPEWLSPLVTVVPGQLLAYHLTSAKGYDPDHPRGLTKVTRTL